MKCSLYVVLGVGLGLTAAGAAIAQDAGGAAPAATAASPGQASAGGRAGADVDMLYAPNAKGGASVGSRSLAVARPPALPPAAKPSAGGAAAPAVRTGGPGAGVPAAPGSVSIGPRPTPGHAAASTMPVGGSVINGTTLARPAVRTTSVGGSTNRTVGVLSGNSFQPKHP